MFPQDFNVSSIAGYCPPNLTADIPDHPTSLRPNDTTEALKARMDLQQIFDKVVAHLLDMDEQASNGTSCVYLTNDGRKCAVGSILPEGEWQSFHGDVHELLENYPQLVEMLGIADDFEEGAAGGSVVELLKELQEVHDFAPNWNDRKDIGGVRPIGVDGLNAYGIFELRRIAERHHLTIPQELYEKEAEAT